MSKQTIEILVKVSKKLIKQNKFQSHRTKKKVAAQKNKNKHKNSFFYLVNKKTSKA